jgi:carbon-monoxide dehydrogenase medium subunit
MRNGDELENNMKRFDYLKPRNLNEVFSILNEKPEKALIVAGGTDVMVMIHQKRISPEVLVSLRGIEGLDRIEEREGLSIGPLVTHRAIEKSERIRREYSALTDAVDVLGSIQIRNVATVAGNICTAAPSADTAPPLLTLGAQVKLKSATSERTVPLENFFTGPGKTVRQPGEVLTEIALPKPLPHTGSAYWKHQRRQALDLPIIGVAVLLSLDRSRVECFDLFRQPSPISTLLHGLEKEEVVCKEVRIGLGVAAPTPMRAMKAEALLRGKKLSDELMDEVAETAAQEAQPRDSIRGEAWYRKEMIRVLVKRMAMRSIERALDPGATAFPLRPWRH